MSRRSRMSKAKKDKLIEHLIWLCNQKKGYNQKEIREIFNGEKMLDDYAEIEKERQDAGKETKIGVELFGFELSQSDISKYFRKCNIKRVEEKGKKVFRPQKRSPLDSIPNDFKDHIKNSTNFENPRILKIDVDYNFEKALCEKIIEVYESKKMTCIPGYRSVVVLCDDLEIYEKIRSHLKLLRRWKLKEKDED